MQDYSAYRAEKNISNNDLIRAVKDEFPAFSKIHLSFANNPQKSALCLVPEAEACLISAFGSGRGLLSAPEMTAAPRKKPKPNRRKPHRLVVYVDEPLFQRVQAAATRRGYVTMQGFLESLLYKIEDDDVEDEE